MMLDVVAVIEAEHVVDPAVMTRRPTGVLVMSMRRAQQQPCEVAGQVRRGEEPRRADGERAPECQHEGDVDREIDRETQRVRHARMVREVTAAPQRQRHAHHERQARAGAGVRRAAAEERSMDERVRNGVGGPPHTDRDRDRPRHDYRLASASARTGA